MGKVKFVDARESAAIAELQEQLSQRQLLLWAADCAERVLPMFEAANPGDDRPRKAIEAGRAWQRGEIPMNAARSAAFASHAAARDAASDAAGAAARAAGHAAATSHVAAHAVHAAAYAAKAASHYAAAANDAGVAIWANAAAAVADERSWQLQQLLAFGAPSNAIAFDRSGTFTRNKI